MADRRSEELSVSVTIGMRSSVTIGDCLIGGSDPHQVQRWDVPEYVMSALFLSTRSPRSSLHCSHAEVVDTFRCLRRRDEWDICSAWQQYTRAGQKQNTWAVMYRTLNV